MKNGTGNQSGARTHMVSSMGFLIAKNQDGSWPKCVLCGKYIPVTARMKKKYCSPQCSRKMNILKRKEKLLAQGHVFKNRGVVNDWAVYKNR